MRVAHLIWGFKAGGSETMLVDIANEQALFNEVTIIIGNTDTDDIVLQSLSNRVKIELIGRPPASHNPWYIFKIIRALRTFKPDIVHAHQESFIKILRFLSVPKVLTVHDTNQKLQSVRAYDEVYSISEAVRHDIQTKQPDARSTIICNGICFSAVKPKSRYGQLPFRVVQVGRLDHRIKGQDILLRALDCLNKKLGEGEVLVDFIGDGTSREYLATLAEELGVSRWCRFLGQLPRKAIYDRLHTYDLLVQPSRYEGFGLTVVEAMAAKVPVLVSDIEGPMEVIGNGSYGDYFRTGDHLDCGNKIVHIIDNSKRSSFQDHLDTVAKYARRTFDVGETARCYLEEYEKIIRRNAAA